MTFTLTLTGLAALGGLVFGTLIALMRLSGFKLLGRIAGLYVDLMRSLPLVLVIFWFYFLVPYIGQWLTGVVAADPCRRVHLLARHLHPVRGGLFLRDHARRHPVDLEGAAGGGAGAGPDLRPDHALRRAAAGVPQHAAGAADADHRAVPGHLAGLCAVDPGFSGRGQQGGAARRAAGRNVSVRGHRLFRHFLYRVVRRPAPADAHQLLSVREAS